MFTIEHDFDATVVTLIDDHATPGAEDISIQIFDDSVAVEQLDPRSDRVQRITFTRAQMEDLRAALDLPEGSYMRKPE